MSNTNKMRVYELAKELGYSSKDFLEMLQKRGVDAHSNFSVLEDATVKSIREMLAKDGPPKPAKAEKPAKPAKVKETEKVVKADKATTEKAEKTKAKEPPPPEEKPAPTPAVAAAAAVNPEVRRVPGGAALVTTIDPERAAAMAMARSSTGPKPKPGGEVRRIIPAARLEALRPQQGAPPRPAEPAVAVSRPAATTSTTTTAAAATTVRPAVSPSTPAVVARTPGSAEAARPAAVPPRPATTTAPPARPVTTARPPAPAAATTASAAPRSAVTPPPPKAVVAEPPTEATAEANRPVEPAPPAVAPSSAPPPRPTRAAGPAVKPTTIAPPLPPVPQFPQRPLSPPPQQHQPRPGSYTGGRRGGGHRGMDRHQPQRKKGGPMIKAPMVQQPTVELKDIEIPDHISVMDLAGKLEISPTEIIKTLMSQGLLVTINQTITFDKAQQIALSHGYNAVLTEEHEEIVQEEEDQDTLVTRPPVVTVLGHVDHGKTSLLDAIRKTNVTAGEAGGITQSIGAYTVDHNGRRVTFIDTPGHEAFTAMRARGAQVTDVAVLVVAADDGVMPQTVEAINHAKAAKVPIVVAINKVDKPQANIDRVKQQLTEYELVGEDWGGQTIMSAVSAKQKQGIDELLEMILLVADMQELKANPARKAHGIIIEGKLDKGLGPVATVLVQTGTLRVGDSVVCGQTYGKVRALINDRGDRVKKAGPAIPAEIIGLSGVPDAGDILQVVDDEKVARQIVEARTHRVREKALGPTSRTTLDDLFQKMQAGEVKDLNLIIKADGQGSVEALKHSLLRLTSPEVRVQVVHGGVGTVTESDILLATASSAIIIGFNVRPDPNVKKLAEQEGVDIRNYRVIYHVIEDIKAAMKGLLSPEFHEVVLGRVEVRQVFKVSKVGTVAGCHVADGKVQRGADVRLLRDGVVVYEGKIESLRRFKDDVREVQAGYECGLSIEKYANIQVGDIIEVYKMEEKPRE